MMRRPWSVQTDSGWNWTPQTGLRTCRTAISTPSSAHAAGSSAGGRSSTAREWYRTAANGDGTPRNSPPPVCRTSEVRPCRTCGAGRTRPPNTWQIPWCPRHTPSSGIRACAITSAQTPKSPGFSGVPGPGEMTTLSKERSRPGVHATSSLRTTTGSAPPSARYCTRLWVNES